MSQWDELIENEQSNTNIEKIEKETTSVEAEIDSETTTEETDQLDDELQNIDIEQVSKLDLSGKDKKENESPEQFAKRIWKEQNPNVSIHLMKKIKDQGLIDELPWKTVENEIEKMSQAGEWPKKATNEQKTELEKALDDIGDLDSWNAWVDAANKAAEHEPEKPKYTDVIEPTGFQQNSEQSASSTWAKINQARTTSSERLKELEITEEEYRNASQQHIISLIERLKKGLITVDELSESEASKITKLLQQKRQ